MQSSSNHWHQSERMAQAGPSMLDDTNASDYSMFTFDDGSEIMLDHEFTDQFGAQFPSFVAGAGGSGAYPDLESGEQEWANIGPYFISSQPQESFAATEGSAQLVMMPGRGHPDLIEEISAEMPGLMKNTTPSISEISGEAPTPPSTPSALPMLMPLGKGYERASQVKRKHQERHCVFPECNNKIFTRQEGLDRHNRTRHNLAKEQFVCQYCAADVASRRTSFVRLDKARSHWKNKHQRDGHPFLPGKERREMYDAAVEMYDAALEDI